MSSVLIITVAVGFLIVVLGMFVLVQELIQVGKWKNLTTEDAFFMPCLILLGIAIIVCSAVYADYGFPKRGGLPSGLRFKVLAQPIRDPEGNGGAEIFLLQYSGGHSSDTFSAEGSFLGKVFSWRAPNGTVVRSRNCEEWAGYLIVGNRGPAKDFIYCLPKSATSTIQIPKN